MKPGKGLLVAAALIAGGAWWLSQRQETVGGLQLAGPGETVLDLLNPRYTEELLGMRQQAETAITAEMAKAAAAGVPWGVWSEYQASPSSQLLRAARMSTGLGETVETIMARGQQAGFDLAKVATFLAGKGMTAQEWFAEKAATSPEFFKEAGYKPTFETATIELPHIGEVNAIQYLAGQEMSAAYLAGGGTVSAGQASIAAQLGVPVGYIGAFGATISSGAFGAAIAGLV